MFSKILSQRAEKGLGMCICCYCHGPSFNEHFDDSCANNFLITLGNKQQNFFHEKKIVSHIKAQCSCANGGKKVARPTLCYYAEVFYTVITQ